MPELSPEAIERIARIARLGLSPGERARFAEQAARILEDFRRVEAALAEPEEAGRLAGLESRPDEPRPPDPATVAAIVAEFPRAEGRLAKVPEGL